MERLRSIARFWNWLPAFRAVGEHCHLPSSAKSLHLSASALSRSVQQLEEALGCNLFRRSNRRLELTNEGEFFLASLRDAMRGVHEAAIAIQGDMLIGELRVCSTGVATSAWVLPTILDLVEAYPDLRLQIETTDTGVIERLLSGKLDVAFGSTRIRHARLHCEKLGEAHAGVYCGPLHPFYGREELDPDEILPHNFVGPPPAGDGTYRDGWPESLERRVVLHVDRMRLGCEACLAAPLLAVLPDLVAERVGRGELHRLPVDLIPSARIYGTMRLRIASRTAAEVVLDAVREKISSEDLGAGARRA